MRLLVLSSRFPWPLDKGDKLRLFHQLKSLSSANEVYLVCLSDHKIQPCDLELVQSFCAEVHIISHQWYHKLLGFFFGLLEGIPFSVAYFYSPSIMSKINKILSGISYDLAYVQLVRMGPYIKQLEKPVVLDYMDAFSFSFMLRAQLSKSILHKYFFAIESNRLKRYEQLMYSHISACTAISARDAQKLNFQSFPFHAIVPNGVDVSFFNRNPTRLDSPEYDIVFVGNLGYFPNVEAASYLVYHILPAVKLKGRRIKILIAGARPSADIYRLKSEDVNIQGDLEDIRHAYQNARIFVAPLFSGAGQQNKMLEAMALGLPCITTSHVNVSIGAADGQELIVADDVAEFVEGIVQLLDQRDLAKRLGVNARNFILDNFAWDANNQRLERLIHRVFAEKQMISKSPTGK